MEGLCRACMLVVLLPVLNFLFFFTVSKLMSPQPPSCPKIKSPISVISSEPCPAPPSIPSFEAIPTCGNLATHSLAQFKTIDTDTFTKYKFDNLVQMKYPPEPTVLWNQHHPFACHTYVNPHVSLKQDCFAAVLSQSATYSFNSIRFNKNWKLMRRLNTDNDEPAGFFKKVSHEKGRSRLVEKMGPFVAHLDEVEELFKSILSKWGKSPGDDIILMVLNEGEVDMLLNFACSCTAHNISLSNVLAVVASEEIVPIVESTGAIAVYHKSFAYASKEASAEYLDRTFVDMMWYKSFSLWMLLKLRFNVLFQDVDLVWFKEPYTFLRSLSISSDSNINPTDAERKFSGSSPFDAFFSDDGQRGIRYTPFFANSGFYYIHASARTEYFAWTIMTQFDILQVSGSHQNVFTTRLIESMDLAGVKPKLLSLNDFPNGVKYHHDKPYMRAMLEGLEKPYNFHMCWTKNKEEKLKYFLATGMWYVQPECELNTLIQGGTYEELAKKMLSEGADKASVENLIKSKCCTRTQYSP